MSERLPLWRAIGGFAVLGSLVLVVLGMIPAYARNYQLGQYAQTVAGEPDSVTASDEKLQAEIAGRARELDLMLPAGDVHIRRDSGRVRLHIGKHKAHVVVVDLHFGEFTTK